MVGERPPLPIHTTQNSWFHEILERERERDRGEEGEEEEEKEELGSTTHQIHLQFVVFSPKSSRDSSSIHF